LQAEILHTLRECAEEAPTESPLRVEEVAGSIRPKKKTSVSLQEMDRAAQCQAALHIFRNHIVFVPESVLLETEWVLRAAYQHSTHACKRDKNGEAVWLALPSFALRAPGWLRQPKLEERRLVGPAGFEPATKGL